jgi:hypothetical protein
MKSRIKLKKYFEVNPRRYYKTNPIPPRTVIAVREENPGPYRKLLGLTLRVGYYSRQDGLNVVWIVYPDGKYGETTTNQHINRHFRTLSASDETDVYGVDQPILLPLDQEGA